MVESLQNFTTAFLPEKFLRKHWRIYIFYVFNMEHPSGYKGRSLSVSDVVEIFLASGGSEFYYCEPIGFKRIRFEKE